jgi:hypothetical protein
MNGTPKRTPSSENATTSMANFSRVPKRTHQRNGEYPQHAIGARVGNRIDGQSASAETLPIHPSQISRRVDTTSILPLPSTHQCAMDIVHGRAQKVLIAPGVSLMPPAAAPDKFGTRHHEPR